MRPAGLRLPPLRPARRGALGGAIARPYFVGNYHQCLYVEAALRDVLDGRNAVAPSSVDVQGSTVVDGDVEAPERNPFRGSSLP